MPVDDRHPPQGFDGLGRLPRVRNHARPFAVHQDFAELRYDEWRTFIQQE